MKKLLIVLGSIAAFVVVVLASVFLATAGAVENADAFFRSVAAGDFERAKTFLSEEFKASTPDDELRSFLQGSGLVDYASSDWGGRSVDTSSGQLTGKVITNSGSVIPLTLTFVREGGEWKIYYIQREDSGLDTAASQLALPSREEAAELVTQTTREFARAVKAKNLAPFRDQASSQFREQVSLQDLNENFDAFLSQDIDLTVLENHEPMFTSDPALSATGVLQVSGYFPTRPSRAWYEYTYVYEAQGWKLLGIDFNVRPVDQP